MSVTVSVTLTDKEYETVKINADALGISVAQYTKRFPVAGDEFEERYDYLKIQAKQQPLCIPFTVMSLFPDWNSIPRGLKLSLGRNFYHLVNRGELAGIRTAGKNSSNIQLYLHQEEEC